MQHPDEGTIHSWLDGALSADEATRVESHVAGCPQCATVVAEARGFIAASSRILTALDDIPRGVVPAAPVRKRDLRVFWRAAAAMLVVAGGSLIVLRDGGQDAQVAVRATDGRVLQPTAPSTPAAARVTESVGEATGAEVGAGTRVVTPQANTGASNQGRAAPPRRDKAAISVEQDLSRTTASRQLSGSASGVTEQAVAADAAAPASGAVQLSTDLATAQSEVPSLKVLRVERTLGGRRTIYEIAPTQTVTLMETESFALSQVVTTGIASTPERRSRTSEAQRAADSATKSMAAAPTARTSSAQTEAGAMFVAPLNTISWTEVGTGRTLTLSGNIPVERLQEIRRRIERERAASSKKIP